MGRSKTVSRLFGVGAVVAGILAACGGEDGVSTFGDDAGASNGDGSVSSNETGTTVIVDEDAGAAVDATVNTDADKPDVFVPPPPVCGDGKKEGLEACDDGNKAPLDGCNEGCQLEPDFVCPTPGQQCQSTLVCGDSKKTGAEQCDDGGKTPGDGCDANCMIEPFWICPTPGLPCTYTVVCGDGLRTGPEECDDGGKADGDGCSATCKVESGYTCPTPGAACFVKCGDGLIVGDEGCDDGNDKDLDGCSSKCQIEDNYKCPTPNVPCVLTNCGDGIKEGSEQCDDGNAKPYDGCFQCKKEPVCTPGASCAAVCGDGIKYPLEVCDDGNTRDGDGCSADCTTIEKGYTCNLQTEALPANLDLPIIYRDFKKFDVAGGHQDFQQYCCGAPTGLVKDLLDASGKPEFLSRRGSGGTDLLKDATEFAKWYRDGAQAKTLLSTLRLKKQVDDSYLFDSRQDLPDGSANPSAPNGYFWPLDNLGWTDPAVPVGEREAMLDGAGGAKHNFFFTSEVKFWFSYDAAATPPVLTFDGDDDVWVFINGKLAVDIGGVHGRVVKGVLIHPTCVGVTPPANTVCKIAKTDLNLDDKNIYDITVFQAERHTTESNYKLTLRGFLKQKSFCDPTCGDGIKTKSEVCDDGVNNATTTPTPYGLCAKDCKSRGGFCGDATLQDPPETCDDGVNKGTYGSCTPECKPGPRCGDKIVQASFEECDNGDGFNVGGYNQCTASCKRGPRCGDGILQKSDGEECDDAVNAGGYNQCGAACKLGPRCGDGLVQAGNGEECDDTINAGGYNLCGVGCKLGARCGDGVVQLANGEQCEPPNTASCNASCKSINPN